MYCVECGGRLAERLLPSEDRPRLVCDLCGYVHYINPKIVVGTLPIEGGRVWLLRRGIEPRLGYWSYPAGFHEIDETTEGAALRETHEELGIAVTLGRLIGIYSHAGSHVVNIVYLASVDSARGAPHTTPEALEIGLFNPSEIPWADLAFPSTHAVLRDWAVSVSMKPNDSSASSPETS